VAAFALLITGMPTAIVMLTPWLLVPVALVAVTFAGNVPTVVGVPEMRPVAVLIASPGGNPVALNVTAGFCVVIW
jgi:hypothetical protein